MRRRRPPAAHNRGGPSAVYAEEQQEILRITAYEGDFLVETGPESRPALDWVFGSTGIRRRLYVGFSDIRDYEIL